MRRTLLWLQLVGTCLLGASACGMPDTSTRNAAIERALSDAFPVLEISTGTELRLSQSALAIVKNAEASGLVDLRHPSWMAAGLIEVVAKPKLVGIALNPEIAWTEKSSSEYLGGEAGNQHRPFQSPRQGQGGEDRQSPDSAKDVLIQGEFFR